MPKKTNQKIKDAIDIAEINSLRWLNPEQAARYLGISEPTLARWRLSGDGPPYSKYGNKNGMVRYSRPGIDAWLEARSRSSTSDGGRS
jgi:predicted DNA-binding transcriptional regulator AlpA